MSKKIILIILSLCSSSIVISQSIHDKSMPPSERQTRWLVGEWSFVNPNGQEGFGGTITFGLDGKYTSYISSIRGQGRWAINKKRTRILIRGFEYAHLDQKTPKIRFEIVTLSPEHLALRFKSKDGEMITNHYEKIK